MVEERQADAPVVVVGFDGSKDSRRALEWAAAECELRGSALTVLHADRWTPAALGLPAFHEEAGIEEDVLARGVGLVRQGHPTVDVTGRRVAPPPGESLVADAGDASLLVLGSRGLGRIQQVAMGSVSRYCVEHAHCPAVVARVDA